VDPGSAPPVAGFRPVPAGLAGRAWGQCDQSQAPGCDRQAAAGLIQAGEPRILIQNPEFIAAPHHKVAFAEARPSDPGGLGSE
jgi:hypothetical protein